MAPRLRPLLTPPNDGTQRENKLDLRVALKKGAGHQIDAPLAQSGQVGHLRKVHKNDRATGRRLWMVSSLETIQLQGFSRSGNDLLSHVLRRSTIGAKALNGRVRNGAGCFALAMITRPRKTLKCPSHVHLCFVYAFDQQPRQPLNERPKPGFYWNKSSLSGN